MSLYIGIFAGGLIVGVLIGWGIVGARNGSSAATTMSDTTGSSTNTATTSTTTAGTVDLSGSMMGVTGLTVPSPQDAGFGVTVSHVRASVPTWLVVYDNNNGTAGKALGAALFLSAAQGGDTSGTISLLRATVPGQSYFVGEAVDNGDRQFSLATDKPVVDEKGNLVLTEFKTN